MYSQFGPAHLVAAMFLFLTVDSINACPGFPYLVAKARKCCQAVQFKLKFVIGLFRKVSLN